MNSMPCAKSANSINVFSAINAINISEIDKKKVKSWAPSVVSVVIVFCLGLAGTGMAFSVQAAVSNSPTCPDGEPANGIDRIGNSKQCRKLERFEPVGASASPKVMVVLLQDSAGAPIIEGEGALGFNLAQTLKATTFTVEGVGGIEHMGGIGPKTNTTPFLKNDYLMGDFDLLAKSLAQLKNQNSQKKVLLIGYAGGAAMAALLASRFPATADAYLLAACPCDLPKWRQSSMAASGAVGALSPQNEVGLIRPDTRMGIVVGNRDDNTLPKFSEAYVASLQARGVKTRLTYAVGATHVSVQRSPEFFMLAQNFMDELSR